ncbi:MAG: hypothetical protein AAGF77_00090 [Bacteroidota bacterium]
MTTHINIHIDKLVLKGHDAQTGRAIGAALEVHLRTLIKDHGLPKSLPHQKPIETLQAGTLRHQVTNADAIGQNIARNIYNSLGQ